ncbi:MAG: NAD(P)H-dependent glycerol-3-phosphate dehydrogenase [Alphaproteobacteria bacterium]
MGQEIRRIGIVGGGAWGTTLSLVARRAGRQVLIWVREPEVAAAINESHENPVFLPAVTLPSEVRATTELEAVADADAVLLVTPAQFLRQVAAELAPSLKVGTPAVICAKGIELGTGALMSEVVAEVLPGAPMAVLSGPTLAVEVARGLPTAVTLACADTDLGSRVVEALGNPRFRIYLSQDLVGAQIGGAVKNVLAIAICIAYGRELGENARAALMTRGMVEMVRLGLAMGSKAGTMMGLSGLGDLALTCSSDQSRNASLGLALGRGRSLADVLAGRREVTEGVTTSAAVMELARRHGVEMPISEAVDRILNHGADIDATIEDLLARPLKVEVPELGMLELLE